MWGQIAGAGLSLAGSLMGGGGGGGTPKWLRRANRRTVERAEDLSKRPYTAFEGDRVADLTENEKMASQLARTYGARFAPFQERLAAGFTPGALSQFENPYLDRVLASRRRGIGEEYGRQASSLARRQSAMDAFRSGRSDLARSRLDESRLRALDDAEGEARHGAFQSALDSYFRQQGVDLGAMEAFGRAGEAEIGALSRTGATERSVEQARRDFDYGQFLERRDWDVNNLNVILNALGVVQGTTKGADKDPLGGILGLLGNWTSEGVFSGLFGGGAGGGSGGVGAFSTYAGGPG